MLLPERALTFPRGKRSQPKVSAALNLPPTAFFTHPGGLEEKNHPTHPPYSQQFHRAHRRANEFSPQKRWKSGKQNPGQGWTKGVGVLLPGRRSAKAQGEKTQPENLYLPALLISCSILALSARQ